MKGEKGNIRKRITRIILWIAGIWVVLLLVLQIVLSPSVLTRIVNRFATEYIDADVSFEKIRLSMFRHFPNAGIIIDDCRITYPSDRFGTAREADTTGTRLAKGYGETCDTLASFDRLSASINLGALLTGKVSIPHVFLSKPRIFAHSYGEGMNNWDVFITEPEDTVKSGMPPVSVGKIRLMKNPRVIYTSPGDTIYAVARMKKMALDGRIDTRKTHKARIGLTVDSLSIAGRTATDTASIRMDMLHIHEHDDHMDIHSAARMLIATRSSGRLDIPVEINGTAAFPRDSILALHGFKALIASIPIGFNADLWKEGGKLAVKGDFNIEDCKADGLLADILGNIIPETKKITTDAVISASGTCEGILGGGSIPAINATLSVPESVISHKDFSHSLRIALNVGAATDSLGRISVILDNAEASTYGLEFSANGSIDDIMGDDPSISISGNLNASADSLATFLPADYGISAYGSISADISGDIRMSQLNIYNFGQAGLKGHIASDALVVKSPKDTIDIDIKGLNINAFPETVTSKVEPGKSFRLTGVSGKIEHADIKFKETMSFCGSKISFAAKNSAEAFSDKDTTRIHPLGGHFDAEELAVSDADGLSLTLDNTSNSFQMVPKKDNDRIPVLSLSSRNKRIYVRDVTGRFILTDAVIKGGAAMNSIERKARFKALMDSLSRANPGATEDSLRRMMRGMRSRSSTYAWMSEDDFKEADLNFTLDGMMAEYFRKWDINGDIDVRTGIFMTPYLPLRNILKGMSISVNNNEVKIKDFKIMSGSSEIAAKGALTGLRRALMGRGAYRLEMSLSSECVDADELLAAYNAGASFNPETEKDKMAEASDSEFLKMVVADSLEKEDLESLIVVPADIEAAIRLDASNITFSDLVINRLEADMAMKERCLQILDMKAETNMGKAGFEGFYATRSKQDISTGFDFNLSDVTSEKVIGMLPAIDTLMPLLKSFKGMLNCKMAATASLDTNMNVITPSINGVLRISGKDLSLSDSEVFSNLAKKLKFKNSEEAKIDSMIVEGVIKDNVMEIFPFVLELDRYTMALSGLHNLDMSYRYHASFIRSPMVFKIGVDIYGPDYDNMKFKIGKPKYKNTKIPVFSAEIDQTIINLSQSIRGIFEKGVEIAVEENSRQEVIAGRKKEIGYVNAVEQKMEDLSDAEMKELEKNADANAGNGTEEIIEITDTLKNE